MNAMNRELQYRFKSLTAFLLISFLFLAANRANAQSPDSAKKYKVYLEPYLMTPSLSGTVGVNNLPNTFICVPASELLKHLQFAGMLYAEVHNNTWAFSSDFFYADLSEDASSKNGVISGTADLKQIIWELEALHRVNPWLEAGLGARINSIENGLSVTSTIGGINKSGSKTSTWVDPLIIARARKWTDNNKWLFSLRADIGGFGIGSTFAWQLEPDIFFRASRLLQIGLGYRALSSDYSTGSGSDRFLYDMDEYGPVLRIGFNL
jgi:hypothetical protein